MVPSDEDIKKIERKLKLESKKNLRTIRSLSNNK